MSARRGLIRVGAVAAALVLVGVPAAAAPAKPALAKELSSRIKLDALNRDLIAFQRIADRNGGQRGPGTPGYDQSAAYTIGKLQAAGFDVTTQEFPVRYSQALTERLIVGGKSFDMNMMLFTTNTPVGGITGQLAVLPPAASYGCDPASFAGVAGKIVLMQRGVCSFGAKELNAAAAGAIGTVTYNNTDGWLRGSLGSDAAAKIPSGGISKADGQALLSQDGAQVTLELRTLDQMRTSRNVIAQTKTGRKDNVVVAGAHLDSVVEGPGINGNATGSAALLETAVQMGGSPKVNNAVRYVFWGAWEFGIIGSPYYVQNLTPEQQLDIAMYLNFDTLGSLNGGYFVDNGDNSPHPQPYGTAQITQSFVDYFGANHVQTAPSPADFRSDQLPFIAAGIPTGGLFTGNQEYKTADQVAMFGGKAGIPLDPCYHEVCDNLGNVDRARMLTNAKAVAFVTASYAVSTESVNGVPPREKRAATRIKSNKVENAAAM